MIARKFLETRTPMNPLFFWSLTSALAGFLFGFDTVVISGAEKSIQQLWDLSGAMHGFALAAALYGTVIGSLVGGWPTDRFGRKKTLLWIGLLYLVSAVWSGLATDVYSFVIARFIGGLGVGISTVASPLYISEIAPPDRRGRLAGMFQFNIVFGILIAFLTNYLIGRSGGENAWRWMLGVEAIPALIYTLLCLRIPESPRWLIARGERGAGVAVLAKGSPEATPRELEALADEILAASQVKSAATGFWSRRLRVPILLAILIAFFNQLSGINVILYFAPRLLGLAGVSDALLASVCIGITNLIFTFVGLALIDKLGRKTLLTIGSFGYIASLGICAWAFLSFVEFKIVSKAIDLEDAADKVVQIDSNARTPRPEEVAAARQNLEQAKAALVAASGDAAYGGQSVLPPSAADSGQLKEVASAAKREASKLLGGRSWLVLLCILGFIAAHAIGQGAVIWVFIAEIFPNKFRAHGQALGSFTHWIFAALLTQLFPLAIGRFEAGYLFLFFAGMMVLQLLWVRLLVPETKGVPLEEMQKKLGIEA
jgi:SP family arabinose:H+ symporter-like MFS transporter